MRLPRTRGDGPDDDHVRHGRLRASPHTRGWTRIDAERRPCLSGFPAHAGMDPSKGLPGPYRRRLPRTRGDGPAPFARPRARHPASPHTRGWTQAVGRPGAALPGFPAHAGMDLPRSVGHGQRPGLPRTRGDGPAITEDEFRRQMASPHTRGWTAGYSRPARRSRGFPAHAGMDPDRRGQSGSRSWLPRTRGDGPVGHYARIVRTAASPHTRCSTSTTFAARVASFRNVTHRPQKDRTASPARIGGNVPAHHRVSCPVHAGARHAGDLVDHYGLYGTGCRRRRRAPDTGH